VIYVKEGVYEETVNVQKKMKNVTMYGDGFSKSIITGSKNTLGGTRLWLTATMSKYYTVIFCSLSTSFN
jgi:pectin methylesterase-like acyl-CoA thioesterase